MADQFCPLDETDCACLDKVLEACPVTREMLLKCKRAGMNVDEAIARNDAQEELAKALKTEFFPNNK